MLVRRQGVTRNLVSVLLLLAGWSGVEAKAYDPLAIDAQFRSPVRDLTVHDPSRDRDIPVRVYLPGDEKPGPIVLFSHGLGGSRAGSKFLGEHWLTENGQGEERKKQDAEAQKLLRLAARELKAKGVGRRDAGELLGVSFQRVQQLVDE